MDLTHLIAFNIALLAAIASPGPAFLVAVKTAVTSGRRAGIAVALGISTGSLSWALMTGSGLSAILAQTAGAPVFVKIAGGLYLLRLAIKSLQTAVAGPKRRNDVAAINVKSGGNNYLRGLAAPSS